MALDKQFLKYKFEKIENDKIWKDQPSKDKAVARKKNAEAAQQHADAIHSYLTGMDPIKIFSNKSFLEPDSMPGNLSLTVKGQLNVAQVEPPATKIAKLIALMRKHKGFGGANQDRGRKLKILKKVFDSLNIIFKSNKLSMDKNFEVKGNVNVGKNIVIGGNNIVKRNLSIIGNSSVRGSLFVKKSGTINNNLLVKKDIIIEKNFIVKQDGTVTNNLNIGKNGIVGGNLTVNKNEIIKGNVQIDKNQFVKESLRVDKKLTVGKNTTLRGNLNVRKNSNTVGIHNVGLALNVMGPAIFGGGLIIAPFPIPPIPGMPRRAKASADFHVKGGDIIGGQDLQITENSVVEGNSTVEGNLEIQGETVLSDQVTIQDDLEVFGDTTFEGNTTFEGDTTVQGNLNLGESVADVNGYTYLPNGILIQWGIDTSDTDGNHTITFPIPFPNNCFSVSVNHKLTGGWNTDEKYGYPITAASYDTNGFVTNRNNAASATINLNYMAIGN